MDTISDLSLQESNGESLLYLRDVDDDGDLDLLTLEGMWFYEEESAGFRKGSRNQFANAEKAFPSNHVADFDDDDDLDLAEYDQGHTSVWLTNDDTVISVSKGDDIFAALVHVAD